MNADLEPPLPSQHKLLARSVRLQQHQAWREAYEQRSGLAGRPREAVEEAVLLALKRDLAVCELLLVLFSTTLTSSRRSTICEPFPSFLRSSNGPLFDEAILHLQAIPPLKQFTLDPESLRRLPLPSLKLLDWIINTQGDGFTMVSVPVTEYMSRTADKTSRRFQQSHTRPDYVFELQYENESERSRTFEASKQAHGWIVAHHGSALENFHSIARFGLCESFGRSSSLFGEGIYLSQDREVAYSFLKASQHGVRGLSVMGERIGILTASEVILDPAIVRTAASPAAASPSLLDAESKPLPSGYVVANAAHAVRTRYLLISTETPCLSADPRTRAFRPSKEVVVTVLVVLYVLGLLLAWYWKKRLGSKAARRSNGWSFWSR